MKTLSRTVTRGVAAGEPLPMPWAEFAEKNLHFRRGSIVMIAGPPGSMKSLLTMNIVSRINVPTLYFSSDSDEFTMAARMLSLLTGKPSDEAEAAVLAKQGEAVKALAKAANVRWSFRSSPTLESMWLEAEAFHELHGEYPHLTVLDILMDVDHEGSGEQNYWALMAELKDMAREMETCLVVVHHTSESAKEGGPPPRAAIMGKANQLPTLILTLWADSYAGRLSIACVKNRFGPQDPTGKTFFQMAVDPDVCQVTELWPDIPKGAHAQPSA